MIQHDHHHPHYPPHHIDKAGEKLVGFPNEILNLLFPEADEAEWAMDNIINEGPSDKQVRGALLMKSIAEILLTVTKITGQKPEFISGTVIEPDDHHRFEEYTYSIQLPEEILKLVKNRVEVLKYIGRGEPHDVLRDAVLFAAFHWIHNQLTKIQNTNADGKKSTQ